MIIVYDDSSETSILVLVELSSSPKFNFIADHQLGQISAYTKVFAIDLTNCFDTDGRFFGPWMRFRPHQGNVHGDGFSYAFQGKNYNLQGYRTGVNTQSFAVRKEILEKAGSLGAGVDNFATPRFNVYNVVNSPYVVQHTTTTLYNLIFKINFTYKIGRQLQERVRKLKVDEGDN